MKFNELVNKAISFLKETYYELKKTTWLTRKQVVGSTLVVIIIVSAIAFFVMTVDFVLAQVLRLFI